MKKIKIGNSVLYCSDETAREHFPANESVDSEKVLNKLKERIENEFTDEDKKNYRKNTEKLNEREFSKKEQINILHDIVSGITKK